MEIKKIIIIVFLVLIVLVASCKTQLAGKEEIKSQEQATSATSNLTDTIDNVGSNLKDISRTLGR